MTASNTPNRSVSDDALASGGPAGDGGFDPSRPARNGVRFAPGDFTYDEACKRLRYDPVTGVLRWSSSTLNQAKCRGKTIHRVKNDGYTVIRIRRRDYFVHRVVFLLMAGDWPNKFVDHIDGNRANNKWSNLRLATWQQNQVNRVARPNATGFSGVKAMREKYQAQCQINGKRVHIGTYASPEDAHAAYVETMRRVHGNFVPRHLGASL